MQEIHKDVPIYGTEVATLPLATTKYDQTRCSHRSEKQINNQIFLFMNLYPFPPRRGGNESESELLFVTYCTSTQ